MHDSMYEALGGKAGQPGAAAVKWAHRGLGKGVTNSGNRRHRKRNLDRKLAYDKLEIYLI